MEHVQFQNTVSSWYLDNPIRQSGLLKDNKLFRMLYDTFCRRSGIERNFEDVVRDGTYLDACMQLFSWYEDRYAGTFGMRTGTKGQKRTVSPDREKYTFDLLYCDERQFKNYLLTDTPQSGSQDLFAFVLHTAVAFLVPLEMLDEVLQCLGFHPLHVKNIHHLAICYVLLGAENKTDYADYNPFEEVEELYSDAAKILRGDTKEPAQTEPGYLFAGQATRMIRQKLFLEKELRKGSFTQLVEWNKDVLNMRHSKILEDFHKLISVFLYIFDDPLLGEEIPEPDGTLEYDYSFYTFVSQYCKDGLSRKKYREQVTGMIDINGKHPTRNIMILLWLYAYCFSCYSRFSGFPGICMEKLAFNRIQKQLRKWNPDWAKRAKQHYRGEVFDVYAFLMDSDLPTVSQDFRGADVIAMINDKLLKHYGWGMLNARLLFDYYILKLEKLVVHAESTDGYIPVEYDGRHMSLRMAEIDNVPMPLVVITQLFAQLKAEIARKRVYSRSADKSLCPLKCSLYEQL